jgi:hypothetical protein
LFNIKLTIIEDTFFLLLKTVEIGGMALNEKYRK